MSNLVLWGHHIDEYQEMFDLTPAQLDGKFLEYSSGPSAFNAEMRQRGKNCISCDPLYTLDKATLTSKTALIFADMAEKVQREEDKFDFSKYGNIDGLIEKRQAGMAVFFADYLAGKKEKRYVPIHDITLPFPDFSFDLAISSHYLFGEIENQDLDFHLQVLKELARVAKEVRVFPLIDRNGKPSPFLGPVLLGLQKDNYGVEVRSVDYHLQPKGNAMLRIWAQECRLGDDAQ
ncbi:MAG: hypothetical protein Q8M03_06505 [Legionella sp.]|nr:hypothetical protein [Legionella sp.]